VNKGFIIGLHPNCMPKKNISEFHSTSYRGLSKLHATSQRCMSELHVGSILAIFFYYLFLISWDAIFYQSIFTFILTLVIPFLFIIDNISEITSYSFKVNLKSDRPLQDVTCNSDIPIYVYFFGMQFGRTGILVIVIL
jgi:hypothetical protein